MNVYKKLTAAILFICLGCQSEMTTVKSSVNTQTITNQYVVNNTDERNPSLTSSSPEGISITWPTVTLQEVITGLNQPVHITPAGDGSGRLFIVEKGGRIKIFLNTVYLGVFLDIHTKVSSSSEQGLLSAVFPPGNAVKRNFYVNYTNLAGDTVIARYQVSADPNLADPASEEILLTIDQPYANHNGGQMAFGPDGYLYIGMGDGGSGGDPENRAQNPGDLLGKLLRIDVEPSKTPLPPAGINRTYIPVIYRSGEVPKYRIPSDNPYINIPGFRPEIWALGLRNPWRFSFDRNSGALFIADVGQDAWEEVNYQSPDSTGGENYGWRILEGNHCYNPSSGCIPPSRYSAPILEYIHGTNDSNGCSITGGYVYRGSAYPALQGIYFYGDFCKGKIWGAANDSGWQNTLLTTAPFLISTFGEDENGELYVADYGNGKIFSIQGS